MIFDSSVPLELQSVVDGRIVSVPLVVVGKASRQVSGYEADVRVCVVEADSHRALVSCHARHPCLLHAPLDVPNVAEGRLFDKDAKRCADELPTP